MAITPQITAHRINGYAPLFVQFSCTGTTASLQTGSAFGPFRTGQEYSDLQYSWQIENERETLEVSL